MNFEWLLGTSDSIVPPQLASAATPANNITWLPLFTHPIEGEPRAHPTWDGAGIEVAGVAAAKLLLAKLPYVLRFGGGDNQGRLQKGDLILISQDSNDDAPIQVVSYRKKSFLARANDDGTWERVANGNKLPDHCGVTGHCVGVVWSPLL